MSLVIENLKFTIFGNGFDSTRNDSGSGAETYEKRIGYGASTACIDETSTYFWITQSQGQLPFKYLGKGKISDLEPVEITTIPTNTRTNLYHPSNVANNYGIAFQNFGNNADVYVFDLTTDEVFYHFNINTGNFYDNEIADCIMVGDDVFYFALRGSGNAMMFKLDVTNETFTQTGSVYFSNGHGCGFVDNDTLYGYNNPVWFSDYAQRYGFDLTGGTQWSRQSSGSGSGGFPRCRERALCANGYIYLAVDVNGAWRWGKFDGNNGGDFETPSPISTFGNFGNSDPRYNDFHVYYNDGRTKCAYVNDDGMWITDFHDVDVVTEEYWKPLAVNEEYIIAIDRHVQNTYIFKYR